jgi:hypothetical protein
MKNNLFLYSIQEVFRCPRYVALASIFAALIGVGIVWLSSYRLIWFAMASDFFNWATKIKILWTSLGVFATNFTLASQIMLVAVSALSGINIAMLIFYFKRTMAIQRASGAGGALGLVIGTFGVGCSACGSAVLSSFLGITTASALVGWLPLQEVEFGILSIALIGASIYLLAKKIQSPVTCLIK